MKYSQLIGIIAALALIGCCFLPWTLIESKQLLITGVYSGDTDFGKPGLMNIFLSVISVICFAVPKIWAKRTNFFIAAINLAWSIRNYLLLTTCIAGDCPSKQPGLFLLLFFAIVIQVMSLLPKINLPAAK